MVMSEDRATDEQMESGWKHNMRKTVEIVEEGSKGRRGKERVVTKRLATTKKMKNLCERRKKATTVDFFTIRNVRYFLGNVSWY